jgi:hypothetical protein
MRNRIREHRKVRVGDLVPHELNPRVHTADQREALHALFGEIGFARSLLAYELADGRLKLIDGHLRQRELDPDDCIDVEILDVTDDEARKLLLSLDPLAQLAEYDASTLDRLQAVTTSDNAVLEAFWSQLSKQDQATRAQLEQATSKPAPPREQFLILLECASEQQQTELLLRFKQEGLTCKALLS